MEAGYSSEGLLHTFLNKWFHAPEDTGSLKMWAIVILFVIIEHTSK
jgi:hypothetical protein